MVTHPPFCPNPSCLYHHRDRFPPRHKRSWWIKDGTYTTHVLGRIQRFFCTSCGTKFSSQTFSLDYGVKKRLPYHEIFTHLTQSGSGIRPLARHFRVTDKVILNRIGRLARQSLALHASLRDHLSLQENLVADGLESFTLSQYFPNNIHILVGKESQYLYGANYAHLRRKGRMTEAQKQRREELSVLFRPPPGEIARSFSQIVAQIRRYGENCRMPVVTVYTDEKREYQEVLRQFPGGGSSSSPKRIEHIRIPSSLPRTLHNDLFPVNYYDREVRKDQSNHVRETVMFSRNVNNCMERFWLYAAYHNYCKPFRIRKRKESKICHAQKAGIPGGEIRRQWKTFFTQRRFYSHCRLTECELFAWFRCFTTPLQLVVPRMPAYAAA